MNNNILFNISDYKNQFINKLKNKVQNNSDQYFLETAKAVEGLFIQMLIKSMRNTLSEENLFDTSQSRLYTDVYDQQLSQEISKNGMGLTKIILEQIKLKKNT